MDLSQALVRLHVTDTTSGRQNLDIAWAKTYWRLSPLPLSYLPCHNDRDDLHLVMEVERETTPGVDKVIVEEPETAPANILRLEVIAI
jgi:hypothetical protein